MRRASNTNDTHAADDTFGRGLALFNRGEFFACHEVWEELWLRSAGAEKDFYQGLIQAAAAILHAERGNPRGAASTWRKARAKLEALPAIHKEVALGEFRDALAEFFTCALEQGASTELPPRPKIKRYRKSS
jgi:predicted metal-dependent hydrolase